jgi:hypothetical protein
VLVTARCWLLRLFFFIDFDHLAALVVSTVGTDGVRQAHRAAIAASYQIARRQSVVGATAVATTLGYFPFWLWGHDFLLLVPQPFFRLRSLHKHAGQMPGVISRRLLHLMLYSGQIIVVEGAYVKTQMRFSVNINMTLQESTTCFQNENCYDFFHFANNAIKSSYGSSNRSCKDQQICLVREWRHVGSY